MVYNSDQHRRRSIRLQHHDYRQGIYFVTICTHARQTFFDHPDAHRIASHHWENLPNFFNRLVLDTWIIMPNHVHGILHLSEPPSTSDDTVSTVAFAPSRHPIVRKVQPGSLGAMMRTYKSMVTHDVHKERVLDAPSVWQRGYWERIVRDETELAAIRQYIIDNPVRWAEDRDNLDALQARMTNIGNP